MTAMAKASPPSIDEQLVRVPSAVRPIVVAAREAVRAAAPDAIEKPYKSNPPGNPSAMWKLARYELNGADVVGLGTFRNHSTLFFYRGRELDDGSGLLQGGGKDSRFVTLREPADAGRREVGALVRKAFELAAG